MFASSPSHFPGRGRPPPPPSQNRRRRPALNGDQVRRGRPGPTAMAPFEGGLGSSNNSNDGGNYNDFHGAGPGDAHRCNDAMGPWHDDTGPRHGPMRPNSSYGAGPSNADRHNDMMGPGNNHAEFSHNGSAWPMHPRNNFGPNNQAYLSYVTGGDGPMHTGGDGPMHSRNNFRPGPVADPGSRADEIERGSLPAFAPTDGWNAGGDRRRPAGGGRNASQRRLHPRRDRPPGRPFHRNPAPRPRPPRTDAPHNNTPGKIDRSDVGSNHFGNRHHRPTAVPPRPPPPLPEEFSEGAAKGARRRDRAGGIPGKRGSSVRREVPPKKSRALIPRAPDNPKATDEGKEEEGTTTKKRKSERSRPRRERGKENCKNKGDDDGSGSLEKQAMKEHKAYCEDLSRICSDPSEAAKSGGRNEEFVHDSNPDSVSVPSRAAISGEASGRTRSIANCPTRPTGEDGEDMDISEDKEEAADDNLDGIEGTAACAMCAPFDLRSRWSVLGAEKVEEATVTKDRKKSEGSSFRREGEKEKSNNGGDGGSVPWKEPVVAPVEGKGKDALIDAECPQLIKEQKSYCEDLLRICSDDASSEEEEKSNGRKEEFGYVSKPNGFSLLAPESQGMGEDGEEMDISDEEEDEGIEETKPKREEKSCKSRKNVVVDLVKENVVDLTGAAPESGPPVVSLFNTGTDSEVPRNNRADLARPRRSRGNGPMHHNNSHGASGQRKGPEPSFSYEESPISGPETDLQKDARNHDSIWARMTKVAEKAERAAFRKCLVHRSQPAGDWTQARIGRDHPPRNAQPCSDAGPRNNRADFSRSNVSPGCSVGGKIGPTDPRNHFRPALDSRGEAGNEFERRSLPASAPFDGMNGCQQRPGQDHPLGRSRGPPPCFNSSHNNMPRNSVNTSTYSGNMQQERQRHRPPAAVPLPPPPLPEDFSKGAKAARQDDHREGKSASASVVSRGASRGDIPRKRGASVRDRPVPPKKSRTSALPEALGKAKVSTSSEGSTSSGIVKGEEEIMTKDRKKSYRDRGKENCNNGEDDGSGSSEKPVAFRADGEKSHASINAEGAPPPKKEHKSDCEDLFQIGVSDAPSLKEDKSDDGKMEPLLVSNPDSLSELEAKAKIARAKPLGHVVDLTGAASMSGTPAASLGDAGIDPGARHDVVPESPRFEKEKRALQLAELKAKAKLARARLRIAEKKKARNRSWTSLQNSGCLAPLVHRPVSTSPVPMRVRDITIESLVIEHVALTGPSDEVRFVESVYGLTSCVDQLIPSSDPVQKAQVVAELSSREENRQKLKLLKQKLRKLETKKTELQKRKTLSSSATTVNTDSKRHPPTQQPSEQNEEGRGKDTTTQNESESSMLDEVSVVKSQDATNATLEHLRGCQKELRPKKGVLLESSTQLRLCADGISSKQTILGQSERWRGCASGSASWRKWSFAARNNC